MTERLVCDTLTVFPPLQALVRAADCVWLRGLLRKGPGLCHGVAGSGYVFLVMHRSVLDIPRVLQSWIPRALEIPRDT